LADKSQDSGVPEIGRRYIENQNIEFEMVWGWGSWGLFYL